MRSRHQALVASFTADFLCPSANSADANAAIPAPDTGWVGGKIGFYLLGAAAILQQLGFVQSLEKTPARPHWVIAQERGVCLSTHLTATQQPFPLDELGGGRHRYLPLRGAYCGELPLGNQRQCVTRCGKLFAIQLEAEQWLQMRHQSRAQFLLFG